MGSKGSGRTRLITRRAILGLVAAAALLSGAVVAQGGAPATDADGNFLMVDVDVSPPRAASGATLRYHAFFGNRDGAFPPREAMNEIRLARGFRLRGRACPRCPLPDRASDLGQTRCPRSARVGRGTFEADPRPTLAERVNGTFTISPEALFSLTKADARLGARRDGKSYVRTPRTCRGAWRFRETVFFEGGGSITAHDRAACSRRRR